MRLSKHTALGNDFLVLVDVDARERVDASVARALCDRRFGVGADGLIRATPAPDGAADVVMELWNSDGGRAEMSGNGIRCLGQAVLDAGLVEHAQIRVVTDGGIRHLAMEPESEHVLRHGTVDMGPARVDDVDPAAFGAARAARVDTGNPHLVLLDEADELDVLRLGVEHPELNVEVVRVDGADHVTMRVHERGAGLTLACGTGSCASAAAAHEWGLVGTRVVVANPGGNVIVDVKPDTMLLSGPTRFVATIDVAPGLLP